MNSGQRMARLAIGAALENMLHAAAALGWFVEVEEPVDSALTMIRVVRREDNARQLPRTIFDRVTNRRLYDGRPIPVAVLDELARETPHLGGVQTHWIGDPTRIKSLASLISRADGVMFGNRFMRRAFLAKVRFDAPQDTKVDEGLPLASLELSRTDRWGLFTLARLPDTVTQLAGVTRVFEKQARRLTESASGICLVAASRNDSQTDLEAGRALQRAWLALTARSLAVQPMMSLAVLDNALEHGSAELIASLARETLRRVRDDARSLLGELKDARVACLLRFGYAAPPSGRTGRLPLTKMVEEGGGMHAEPQQPLSR